MGGPGLRSSELSADNTRSREQPHSVIDIPDFNIPIEVFVENKTKIDTDNMFRGKKRHPRGGLDTKESALNGDYRRPHRKTKQRYTFLYLQLLIFMAYHSNHINANHGHWI